MFTRPGIFKCFWSSGVRWLELAGTSTEKNSPWFGPKVQRSRTCWSGLLVARRQRKIPRSTLLWFGYASCKMFREQNRTRAFVTGWWFGTSFIFRTLGMSSSQLTNVFQRGWNHQPDNSLKWQLLFYIVLSILGVTRSIWNLFVDQRRSVCCKFTEGKILGIWSQLFWDRSHKNFRVWWVESYIYIILYIFIYLYPIFIDILWYIQ